MASSCEHGNEPSVSIKGGKFEYLSVLLASQEGFCSMELVNFNCSGYRVSIWMGRLILMMSGCWEGTVSAACNVLIMSAFK
jgi:hypothetical protein